MSPGGATSGRSKRPVPASAFLTKLLQQHPHPAIDRVMMDRARFRPRIVYTRIDRDSAGVPVFSTHRLGEKSAAYFYPASAAKLPLALCALEKLHLTGDPRLTVDTPFYAPGDGPGGEILPTTIRRCIRGIFAVSDNRAANRLYEFTGPEALARSLTAKGYRHTEVRHRFGLPPDRALDAGSGAVRFLHGSTEIYSRPAVHRPPAPPPSGFPAEGTSNCVSLEELLEMLKNIIFPASVTGKRRFDISPGDLAMVKQAMGAFPGEGTPPLYDPECYPPAYCKFILWGGARDISIPPYLRVYNKAGWAYGQLTDVAYVTDELHGVEFMVAATLSTGDSDAARGDAPDYDAVCKPFLGALGQLIYAYELQRTGKYLPPPARYNPFTRQTRGAERKFY
jgi:hypothetical protein